MAVFWHREIVSRTPGTGSRLGARSRHANGALTPRDRPVAFSNSDIRDTQPVSEPVRELGLFFGCLALPFRSSGSLLLLLRARDSAVRRRNDGVSALRCRMCISVMCVEVGRAAGLIRSSQLFPPSLSSRSLEYCAVRSVRLSHNPFITSIAITETSFLSPSRPKRRPHATILRTLPPVCRI